MIKHTDQVLTAKRKRIMIYFIDAAQRLIQSEGIDGLSIRKIANETGYNSATLYNYFEDLEHLTLFGSVCYLRDYVLALSRSIPPGTSSLDSYKITYRCFNDIAFQNPDIFHNLFFGRHSELLGDVLHTYYYELFPHELDGISEPLRKMMVSGSMMERDSVFMDAMVKDGYIAPEKAKMTLDLIIAVHQTFIHEAYIHCSHLDIEAHKARFNEIFEYILEMGK